MMRRALILMMITAMSARAGLEKAAPAPEQAELQAAQAAWTAIGNQRASGIDTSEAVERLDRVFAELEAKYPGSAEVVEKYGNFLVWANRRQEAFEKWQEAEKLDGNNADICYRLGYGWLDRGDKRRSTGYFERAVALAPQEAEFHDALGTNMWMFRHDLTTAQEPETALVDRALAEMKAAADLAPFDPSYAREYANVFYSIPIPHWPEALKAWRHYYDITPDKDLAAVNLARVSLEMKDAPAVRRYLGEVHGSAYQGVKSKLLAQANRLPF